jgi:hypothetical protein
VKTSGPARALSGWWKPLFSSVIAPGRPRSEKLDIVSGGALSTPRD